MSNPTAFIQSLLGWIITLLIPVILILTAVRVLLTPAWVHVEYRTPNFPQDPYGLTLADRVKWSLVSLNYLVNNESIDFLGKQFFEDGSPLFNTRELGHMQDVKNVVKTALLIWWSFLLAVVLIGAALYAVGGSSELRVALTRGSWVTLGLVGVVVLLVLLAFGGFFVFFHQIFFPPGTWTFLYTDTLIRLFPERFWRDAFLWIGALTVLQALWIISLARPK